MLLHTTEPILLKLLIVRNSIIINSVFTLNLNFLLKKTFYVGKQGFLTFYGYSQLQICHDFTLDV